MVSDAHRLAEENLGLAFTYAAQHQLAAPEVLTYAYEGLLRACQKYDPSHGGLGTYAYLWMRSITGRWVRREAQLARRNVPVFHDGRGRGVFSERSFEEGSIERQDREAIRPRLRAAVAAMSSTDREAIELHFGAGRSFVEMSQILGLSIEGARQRVLRAVGRLREAMAQPGQIPRG